VGGLPPSPEWVSERKDKHGNSFRLDTGDDSYYTLSISDNENDHSHPKSVDLFPLRFPVSDELRNKLEARYRKHCLGE